MPDFSLRTRRAATVAEKATLGFIAGAAVAVAVVSTIFAVGHIVDLVTGGPATLRDAVLADAVDVELSGALAGTADTVDFTVASLPDGATAALVGAAAIGAALTIGVCGVVALLCVRILLGRPFVRSATWGIAVVAILVLLAALGRPLLTGVAHAEAAAGLGLDALAPFAVELDPAPLGWSFALTVVAGAFEIGQRLQRDAEGLV